LIKFFTYKQLYRVFILTFFLHLFISISSYKYIQKSLCQCDHYDQISSRIAHELWPHFISSFLKNRLNFSYNLIFPLADCFLKLRNQINHAFPYVIQLIILFVRICYQRLLLSSKHRALIYWFMLFFFGRKFSLILKPKLFQNFSKNFREFFSF
jgi:hypothetical protein